MKLLNCVIITICLILTITACAVNAPTAPTATLTASPTYKVIATKTPTDAPEPTPRVNDIDVDNIEEGDVFLGFTVKKVERDENYWPKYIEFEGEITFDGSYKYG